MHITIRKTYPINLKWILLLVFACFSANFKVSKKVLSLVAKDLRIQSHLKLFLTVEMVELVFKENFSNIFAQISSSEGKTFLLKIEFKSITRSKAKQFEETCRFPDSEATTVIKFKRKKWNGIWNHFCNNCIVNVWVSHWS